MCMRARLSILSLSIPILCALALLTGTLWAAPTATAPHLTVQLVVPPAQIYPGQALPRACISSSIPAGMFTGSMPETLVSLRRSSGPLPPAITADAIQFPAPKRLPLGPLMDYGYENEVLFPIPMRVAANFKPSRTECDARRQGELAGLPRGLHSREGAALGGSSGSGESSAGRYSECSRRAAAGKVQRHSAATAARARRSKISCLRQWL